MKPMKRDAYLRDFLKKFMGDYSISIADYPDAMVVALHLGLIEFINDSGFWQHPHYRLTALGEIYIDDSIPSASEPETDIEYNIGTKTGGSLGHFYSAAVLEKFIVERGQREIDFVALQADMRRMADENERLRAFVRQLDDISIATIPHASLISIVYRWQREARALLEAETVPEAGGDNV